MFLLIFFSLLLVASVVSIIVTLVHQMFGVAWLLMIPFVISIFGIWYTNNVANLLENAQKK
jgi:hypothetical protein